MSKPKDATIPHVEVPDATAAFHRLEDFTRRILAVPKKNVEEKLPREKPIPRNRKR